MSQLQNNEECEALAEEEAVVSASTSDDISPEAQARVGLLITYLASICQLTIEKNENLGKTRRDFSA